MTNPVERERKKIEKSARAYAKLTPGKGVHERLKNHGYAVAFVEQTLRDFYCAAVERRRRITKLEAKVKSWEERWNDEHEQ